MTARTIAAKLPDLEAAEAAIQDLLANHIPKDAISVMARADGEVVERDLQHESGIVPAASVGGTLGGILGLLGATAAAGPVGAAIAIVGGAAAGTLGGGMAGLGWWRETAEAHSDEFDDDTAVWVAVQHQTMTDRAANVLRERGARVYERGADAREGLVETFPASDPPSSSSSGHA